MTEQKIFVTVSEAAKLTGLSQFFVRNGIKDGTIPHIKSGSKYLINYPQFLHVLDRLTTGG